MQPAKQTKVMVARLPNMFFELMSMRPEVWSSGRVVTKFTVSSGQVDHQIVVPELEERLIVDLNQARKKGGKVIVEVTGYRKGENVTLGKGSGESLSEVIVSTRPMIGISRVVDTSKFKI